MATYDRNDQYCNEPKIKLFFGNSAGTRADRLFGEWIEEHPHVKIVDFRYEQARYGDHSIAIIYEENKK